MTWQAHEWRLSLQQRRRSAVVLQSENKANKVEADLQVATLLTHIGADIFAKLHDLLDPVAPEDKTFAELKDILKTHFEPKTV